MNSSPEKTWLLGLGAIGLLLIATLVAVIASFTRNGQPQPTPTARGAAHFPAVPTLLSPTFTFSSLSINSATPGRGELGIVTLEDGLSQLSSFRATFALTASGQAQDVPAALNARLTMIEEQVGALDAERVVYAYSDTLRFQAYQFSEQVRLGNSSFLVTSQADGSIDCMAQPVRQSTRWKLIPFSYSDLGDLSDARYVGDETALPVRARHYVVERSLLGDFPAGHANVWIAAEGGYVVKLQAEASGLGDFQSYPSFEGRLVARYELSQVNQPFSIEPPAACTGDTPIMPGAEEVSIAGNLITYKVNSSIATATEFYTRQMPKHGWEAAEDISDQGVTTLIFQRKDQVASVLLSSNTQDDVARIIIIITTDR